MQTSPNILFNAHTATHWANIILPLALPTIYTYTIPTHFLPKMQIGCRVEVELKNKKYSGLIKSITNEKPAYTTKEIINVLDDEPIVYPQQLALWQWIAQYYMCTEGEVMAAALPTNFKLSSETILIYNEELGEDFTHLNDEEFLVAEALLIKKELRLSEVQQILDVSHVYPVIKKLIDKNVCMVWEAMDEKYKIKKENFIVLNPVYNKEEELSQKLNEWKGAPKQMELLLAYLHLQKTEGDVIQTALLKKANATAAQLKGLVDKDILWVEKRSVDRIKLLPKNVHIDFEFSQAQQQAANEVSVALETRPVCLLHGITGSGKTQVYVKLIEKYFTQGKQVLYLLPEIALTTQIIRRLQKHFGGNITIFF